MTIPDRSIWSYQDNFDFRKDISEDSEFHVSLEPHRGEYSRRKMLTEFKLDDAGVLKPGTKPCAAHAVFFGGHLGCGKSTELRDYANLLKKTYTVSAFEITKSLDINDLRFSDLLIGLTHALVSVFQRAELSLTPHPVFLNPIIDWFDQRIVKQERFRALEGEVATTAKVGAGLPFLAALTATLMAKVKTGATYREELRKEIRDGFTVLVQHFNALIEHANELLSKQSQGPLLFIIDGTDKLSQEDSEKFFSGGLTQLTQINVNLIVCAPISVLLEQPSVGTRFTRVHLPMVKVLNSDGSERPAERDALVSVVAKRLPLNHFDTIETVQYLVMKSGGHLRDLIRLVRACFSRLDEGPITRPVAEAAVRELAVERQRDVKQDHWADLVKIDHSNGTDVERTDDRLSMLYHLVLLEYNNYWWRSHPLVQSLPAYERALAKAQVQGAAESA